MSELFNVQHAGGLQHIHIFQFPDSSIQLVKEIRLGVSIVVAGWVAVTLIQSLASLRTQRKA